MAFFLLPPPFPLIALSLFHPLLIKKDVEGVEVANRLPAASEMLAGLRRVLGFLESQILQMKKFAMRSAVDGVDVGEGETSMRW